MYHTFVLPVRQYGRISFSTQAFLSNPNVVTNSGGVISGTGISTGNVEFWPTNYGTGNSSGVPGASGSVFDMGDDPYGSGNYGSFQIHNYGAGETIICLSTNGAGFCLMKPVTLESAMHTGNADWTFAYNADDYLVSKLYRFWYDHPLSIDSSLERAIFQRNSQNEGWR